MISVAQLKRIRLYLPSERAKAKAEQRRRDAAEVRQGNAKAVQDRNRALPHASLGVFVGREGELPTELIDAAVRGRSNSSFRRSRRPAR